ncbi:MAG: cation:proton antiporter [Actinomycetota bacterium]|nr:cation:proton antiporter [Actinomycetota bacterium]MDA3013118.1 cation:proton antiporter [Actinomycetota bacterium]
MENFEASSLVVIALGAFLLPLFAERIKIPGIVLEIAYGILVGPVLGFVSTSEFISGLAILGFLLLMFLSGFEIDLETFREKGIKTLALPLVIYFGTVVSAFYIISTLKYPLFLALVLCTTSVDIVITVLRSDETIKTNYGQSLFIIALLADILTLLAATVYASFVGSGTLSLNNLNVVFYFIVVILILRIIKRVAWWNPQIFSRMFDGNDPEELGIRSSLALMLTLVGLSVLFDIEPILGAFLAGTIFAFTFSNRGSLENSLKGFSYGFLIPIFFINIGLNYDISVFKETQFFLEVGYLFLIAVGVKFIPSLLLIFSKIKIRDIFAAGFLLSARFSLIIAMAEIGVHLNLLTVQLEQQIILLAVLTATFSPILFRIIRSKTN